MTSLPMDSSEVNPTWTLESPQMSIDENSQAIPGKPDLGGGVQKGKRLPSFLLY